MEVVGTDEVDGDAEGDVEGEGEGDGDDGEGEGEDGEGGGGEDRDRGAEEGDEEGEGGDGGEGAAAEQEGEPHRPVPLAVSRLSTPLHLQSSPQTLTPGQKVGLTPNSALALELQNAAEGGKGADLLSPGGISVADTPLSIPKDKDDVKKHL